MQMQVNSICSHYCQITRELSNSSINYFWWCWGQEKHRMAFLQFWYTVYIYMLTCTGITSKSNRRLKSVYNGKREVVHTLKIVIQWGNISTTEVFVKQTPMCKKNRWYIQRKRQLQWDQNIVTNSFSSCTITVLYICLPLYTCKKNVFIQFLFIYTLHMLLASLSVVATWVYAYSG